MKFEPLPLPGACLIRFEPLADDRGYFARSFCAREFAAAGLETDFVQGNVSYNARRGALRGLHYQAAPGEEAKTVRCVRGEIFDVILDLRPDSPAFGRWTAVVLREGEPVALYVPKGLAHGFQTLRDDTEILYGMSQYYSPELARGVLWRDPDLAIPWPEPAVVVSDRDNALPPWREVARSLAQG